NQRQHGRPVAVGPGTPAAGNLGPAMWLGATGAGAHGAAAGVAVGPRSGVVYQRAPRGALLDAVRIRGPQRTTVPGRGQSGPRTSRRPQRRQGDGASGGVGKNPPRLGALHGKTATDRPAPPAELQPAAHAQVPEG